MQRADIIAQLFDTMDIAKRSMHSHMQTVIAGHPISRAELEVLFTIHLNQPTTAKQLATKLQLTPGAISQLVDGLSEQRLLERETDPADRRRHVLRLSTDGQTLITEFDTRRRAVLNRVIEDLSDAELATWLKIQQQIIDVFQSLQHE